MNQRRQRSFMKLKKAGHNLMLLGGLFVLCSAWMPEVQAAQPKHRKYISRYVYYCAGDVRVTTDLYQNTSTGNHQITIAFRTGGAVALDQTPAASGVRFSDEINYVFWMKGNEAVIEVPDENGDWRVQYNNCRYNPNAAAES